MRVENIVAIPYDVTWKAVDWAKKNCPSYVTNYVLEEKVKMTQRPIICYVFSDEKDAIIFALRWK